MAALDSGGIAAATISIGQTIAAYQFFLPKLQDVRKADSADEDMRADVLIGQLAAGSVSMTVGGMLTAMTGSQAPVWATLFIAVVMAVIYQYTMNGNRVMNDG